MCGVAGGHGHMPSESISAVMETAATDVESSADPTAPRNLAGPYLEQV